jgi:hypothetical protein
MSRLVDVVPRRAAWLHEAKLAGFETPKEIADLLENPANAAHLADVTQRAKEAIVDFGELSQAERNFARQIIFIYPWVKGSTKYAGHFLRDHPVQAAALSQLGKQGQAINEAQLGPTPSYYQGMFKLGGGVVNPASLNPFSTPAELARTGAAYATGNFAAQTGASSLAPTFSMLTQLLSRHDELGRPIKGNIAAQLRQVGIEGTPQAALIRAAAAGRKDALGEIARRVAGSRQATKAFPETADPYWRFLFGGLYPRQYDPAALHQQAARQAAGQ